MYSVSRPTPSLDSKATCSPKTSAPQAGGTAEGSSSPKAASGIKPKEEKLAGYLLARAAMHRHIDKFPEIEWEIDPSSPRQPGEKATLTGKFDKRTDTLENLRAGHESVQQVSELLPLGRANVIQDIEKAKGEHISLRKLASHKLENDLIAFSEKKSGVRMTETDFLRVEAASSQFAKTGTCGSFAANTTPMHAAKLADRKAKRAIVAQSEHTEVNHAWAEMMPKGKREDGTPILHGKDVIMDGWCKENLAILREDSEYARLDKHGKAVQVKHLDLLDHKTGFEALQEIGKHKATIAGNQDLQDSFKRRFDSLVEEKYEWNKNNLWNAESVFHADFREQAGKALHKGVEHLRAAKDFLKAAKYAEVAKDSPTEKKVRTRTARFKHASMAEIQAVGVARSLGSDIPVAVAEAHPIIDSAKEMSPRPTSKK